ncbi:MAG: alpha/beta fold hydrolase [Azoarcus sp.]|nr:alpha/beta fold hydrolase [Azoarcus sp.]
MNSPANTPLVFLHGWAMTPAVWRPLLAALGGAASEIHTPALPGHDGGAARPPATLAAWAEALAPALPPNAVLIGWSLGALLALEIARLRPGCAARLILFGATPRFVASPGWPHGLEAATVAAFVDGYEHDPAAALRRVLALQTLGDDARRQLLPALEAASAPRAGQALPALADGLRILASADLRPHLAAIASPVRLIHGDGDALMPPAAARWLAEALPRARLTVLEKRGHAPMLSDAAACAAAIRACLGTEGSSP